MAREELAQVAPRALAEADQRRFLRAVEGCPLARDRAIATVFFYTGLRLSELATLEVGVGQRGGFGAVEEGEHRLEPVAARGELAGMWPYRRIA